MQTSCNDQIMGLKISHTLVKKNGITETVFDVSVVNYSPTDIQKPQELFLPVNLTYIH